MEKFPRVHTDTITGLGSPPAFCSPELGIHLGLWAKGINSEGSDHSGKAPWENTPSGKTRSSCTAPPQPLRGPASSSLSCERPPPSTDQPSAKSASCPPRIPFCSISYAQCWKRAPKGFGCMCLGATWGWFMAMDGAGAEHEVQEDAWGEERCRWGGSDCDNKSPQRACLAGCTARTSRECCGPGPTPASLMWYKSSAALSFEFCSW